MAATTIPAHANAITPPWRRVRNVLTTVTRQGVKVARTARHRLRRPALVISGFGCMDASAWHTFGLGAGLLALGLSLWAFEWLSGDDEPGGSA